MTRYIMIDREGKPNTILWKDIARMTVKDRQVPSEVEPLAP